MGEKVAWIWRGEGQPLTTWTDVPCFLKYLLLFDFFVSHVPHFPAETGVLRSDFPLRFATCPC